MDRLVRLAPSAGLKERRLREQAGDAFDRDPALRQAVAEAQARGSLELAGLAADPDAVAALLRARDRVPPQAPLTPDALAAWHAAVLGAPSAYRRGDSAREGSPPPAPPAFIESRLQTLAHWLDVESARELSPAQAGALVLARVVEIHPWDDGNGRVARLAASHAMVRAGARPPVLVGADAERLREATRAAFALHTEPLARLLDEASERALDAMLAALTR